MAKSETEQWCLVHSIVHKYSFNVYRTGQQSGVHLLLLSALTCQKAHCLEPQKLFSSFVGEHIQLVLGQKPVGSKVLDELPTFGGVDEWIVDTVHDSVSLCCHEQHLERLHGEHPGGGDPDVAVPDILETSVVLRREYPVDSVKKHWQ